MLWKKFCGRSENVGSYGGGSSPPIIHQMAMVTGNPGSPRIAIATLPIHQPRAIAYDPAHDRLYLFGYGSDSMLAVSDASQASIGLSYQRTLTEAPDCGPTGADIAKDGSLIAEQWVLTAAHCVTPNIGIGKLTYTRTNSNGNVQTETRDHAQNVGPANNRGVFIHPGYDPKKDHANDIALIKLAQSFGYEDASYTLAVEQFMHTPGFFVARR